MTDFLKINLEDYNQPAYVRLSDSIEYGAIEITQAKLDTSGVTFETLRTAKKPKQYTLTTEEANAFCDAWMDYKARKMQHTVAIEECRKATIAEAKALAKSVRFDLEGLNIRAKRDGDLWCISVPALAIERHAYDDELKEAVQGVLDRLHRDVLYAEQHHWTGSEWTEIIASYRRAMATCQQCGKSDLPLNQESRRCVRCVVDNETAAKTEQGEPTEIVEARALLKEI